MEQHALTADGIECGLPLLGDGMRATGQGIAATQRLIGGLEIHHAIGELVGRELVKGPGQLAKPMALRAQVADHGQMPAHTVPQAAHARHV